MTLQKSKRYTVVEAANVLGADVQKIRRYVDEFDLGTWAKGDRGFDIRFLEEKDLDELAGILDLREKGLTPKTIKVLRSNELQVVKRDDLAKLQQRVDESFEKYGKDYLALVERLEKVEKQNQELLQLQAPAEEKKENEKDKKLEELYEKIDKLTEEVQKNKEEKQRKNQFPWALFQRKKKG